MLYRLADRLGKSIPEILEMTQTELAGWMTYFTIMQKNKES